MKRQRESRLCVGGCIAGLLFLMGLLSSQNTHAQDVLPGTERLQLEGDIAMQLVEGVDRFLLGEIEKSVEQRHRFWKRDYTSAEAYSTSVDANRQQLREMLGLVEPRAADSTPELIGTLDTPALVGRSDGVDIFAVRWPAFGRVTGEGLMLVPRDRRPVANVVAIPDADQHPEQLAGLIEGIPAASQFARRLAENGCRVIVPTVIDRRMNRRAAPGQNPRANLTNREYLYRPAFELGRHLIGHEIQKVLACVDWFERAADGKEVHVGVMGYGEGGLLALYSGAIDTRIDAVCVSGYFGSRQSIWQEPIDRNVFGLLEQFGDAEIASLVAPRMLVVDGCPGPELELPSEGGAPAMLKAQTTAAVAAEKRRLLDMVRQIPPRQPTATSVAKQWTIDSEPGIDICGSETLASFLEYFDSQMTLRTADGPVEATRDRFETEARQQRQIDEIDRHNQWLLRESPFVRRDFMGDLDTSSLPKFQESVEPYRDFFRNEIIGSFDRSLAAPMPRSRRSYDEALWSGYEVTLNVFPDVIAYGILCVPKGISPGERRPVVVCQHGLEGRPQDVVAGDHRAYHDYAAKLAERGFVTFAPQNIYIGRDRFRTLQRKANPVKKTLFSIMVPQHQQIVDWLGSLSFVDPKRIAFYGLSYGGKSAMRIPPLVDNYCLAICSADFNDWITKCASNRDRYSYVFTNEYEMFEWNLGRTFNYSEMAALIAPRPFMVERGHFDGVAPDEWVAYEFAKVRNLYQARLGIGDRTEIEFFVGPHTINGKGTFDFLHRHLDWNASRKTQTAKRK